MEKLPTRFEFYSVSFSTHLRHANLVTVTDCFLGYSITSKSRNICLSLSHEVVSLVRFGAFSLLRFGGIIVTV